MLGQTVKTRNRITRFMSADTNNIFNNPNYVNNLHNKNNAELAQLINNLNSYIDKVK